MRQHGGLAAAVAFLLAGCVATQSAVAPSESPSPEPSPLTLVTPAPTEAPSPPPTPTETPYKTESPAPVPARTVPATPTLAAANDLDVVCSSPCWPLSGKPLDGNAAVRPLAVRFDNATTAQPQAGLNAADVIFDTIIEGCVNRLLAVYHSRGSASLGSIRSARRYDLQLMPMLRGVLAHVGASDDVSQQIRDAAALGEFIDIDEFQYHPELYPDYHKYYWRVNWKLQPHNMYSSSSSLNAAADTVTGGGAAVVVPNLGFLPSVTHEATAGGFAQSVAAPRITFPATNGQACPQGNTILGYRDDYVPTYTYDTASRGYRRYASGTLTLDEYTKSAVLARNVVVMSIKLDVTDIIASQGSWGVAYQVQPYTTGSGALSIFRDGRRINGTWSRATRFDPFEFRNAAGERILLSPGQTWIHFMPTYWTVP